MNLSHFEAMALFALVVSVALAMLSRRTPQSRIRYAAGAFLAFLLLAIAVAWLMYLAAE